jgi:glutaredoxin
MAFSFLRRWLARTAVPRPDLHFLLYTRAACPLCDEACEMLLRYQKSHRFVLEIKDVDEAEDLVHEFGACVPVVTIDGQVRFRGHINEVLLQRILDAKVEQGP